MLEDEQFIESPDPQDEAEDILIGGFRKNERYLTNIFSSNHLGIIDSCETNKDGDYTGRARVTLVTTPGVRQNCLIPIPSGQSFFCGGVPPAGSLCQVSWLPNGVAVITAIYPISLRDLIDVRELHDIIPGEILLQASSGISKEEQVSQGRLFLDRHGRIIVETKDGTAKITLGDPGLPNNLSDADSEDSETGEKTLLRIESGDAVINLTENSNITIKNSYGKVVLEGNRMTISNDARIDIAAPTIIVSGATTISGSSISISSSGELNLQAPGGKRLATEDFVLGVYNRHTHQAGALVTTGGDGVVGITATPVQQGSSSHLTDEARIR